MGVLGEGDRFKGFRDRLSAKYAWLYGYLCKQQSELWTDLDNLQYVDPLDKITHRVRPSIAAKLAEEEDRNFVERQSKMESDLAVLTEKIATWNAYFTVPEV